MDLGDAASAAPGVEGNDVFRPGSLGELANLLERVEHLVVEDGEVEHLVEDGEVEHQTEVNWMRGLHLVFFFSSVLTDSILYEVWNMVQCFLRGPFDV